MLPCLILHRCCALARFVCRGALRWRELKFVPSLVRMCFYVRSLLDWAARVGAGRQDFRVAAPPIAPQQSGVMSGMSALGAKFGFGGRK